VEELLTAEGIEVHNCTRAFRVERTSTGKRVHGECVISTHDHFKQPGHFDVEEVFIATGRRPNVESLGLENAGVETNRQGVVIDEQLRTTAKNIWAAGDITGKYLFTHVAEYQGRLVVGNALFPLHRKADYRVVPWTTFTDPEVARVGLTEAEAREQNGEVRVYRYSFGDLDRAIIDSEGKGFAKVVCTPKGQILGAHLIGPHAGDVIQELVLALKVGIKIQTLSQTIHTYPTLSEVVRRTADAYYREKLFSGRLPHILKKVFNFLRGERL
jgi:pyruvate/2-oxoglutarate dehydrogenase complex dihydrolipoamide dehydrogenase (E3) component